MVLYKHDPLYHYRGFAGHTTPEGKVLPMLITETPRPKWHGFKDPQLVQNYTKFVSAHLERTMMTRPAQLEKDIRDHKANNVYLVEDIRHCRTAINNHRDKLAECRRQLVDTSGIQFDNSLQAVEELPYVIGLRSSSAGRLVVHTRLFAAHEGSERYLGDFEITFKLTTMHYDGSRIELAKTDYRPGQTLRSYGFDTTGYPDDDHVVHGFISISTDHSKQLLREGRLAEMVAQVIAKITMREKRYASELEEHVVPMPTWTGTAPNLAPVAARTIDLIVNEQLRNEIASHEQSLASHNERADQLAQKLQEQTLQLTRLQAELDEINRTEKPFEVDKEVTKAQLKYMTSLPDVMGMKFDDAGIPVFHIRTAFQDNDSFYDLGDFEVTLKQNPYEPGMGVVAVTRTRHNDSRHPYFHEEYRTESDWFCFGSRAGELRELFRKGEFGAFLHLLINTMNSVNLFDRDRIKRHMPQVAPQAKWVSHPPRIRQRRQKRLGATAIPAAS